MSGGGSTSTTTSNGGGGFVMPPKNHALKKEEEAAMHGADLTVCLHMPDGSEQTLEVKTATEVGFVKLLLAQKLKMPPKDTNKLSLLLDGKPMIDPMSLCDYAGISPPEAHVDVKIA